jgi:hypothetical protein
MAKHFGAIVSVFVLMLISGPTAKAGPNECRDAVNSYNSALSDVSDALKRYANCISDSQGHDDCSTEFSSLRSDQDDFESAVSAYESECD